MRILPIGDDSEPLLAPDLVWNGLTGDLVLTEANDATNPSGFRATSAIATAVLICLQTDVRVDPVELRDGDRNRGWPGDAFDMRPGEMPLGSKLWLLRRASLREGIEIDAEDYAREALQTLVDQGVCVRVDVSVTADRPRNRLDLEVNLFGRDDSSVYQGRFAVLWDQVRAL